MIRDFSLWGRVCRDSDGGGGSGGGSSGGYSGKGGQDSPGEGRGGFAAAAAAPSGGGKSGKGTDAAAGYAQAAASMGAAGIGSVGGKSVGYSGKGGYDSPSESVGGPGSKSGGFAQAASSKEFSGRLGSDGRETAMGRGAPAIGVEGVSTSSKSVEAPSPQLSAMSGGLYGAAAAAPSYSGKVGSGLDSPAEAGPGPGGKVGGYSGRGGGYDTPSESSSVGRGSGLGAFGGAGQSRDTSMASASRAAENQSMATYSTIQSFLGTLKSAEGRATNPYGTPVYGVPFAPPKDLTEMTIAEVQAYQAAIQAAGAKSTAVGAFQMRDTTLAMAATMAGVSKDSKFSKSMQDHLAMTLAQNRANQATVNGKVDPGKFASKLAAEWAAFEDTNGKSRYAGVGNNKASVDSAKVAALAQSLIDTGAVHAKGTAPGGGKKSAAAPAAEVADLSLPDDVPTPTSRVVGMMPDEAPVPTSRISNFADPPDEGRFAAKYLSVDPQVGRTAAYQQFAETIGKTNVMGIDGKTAPYGTVQSGSFNESQRGAAAAADVGSRAGRVADALAPQPSRELSAMRSGWSDGPEPLSDVTSPELSAMNPQVAEVDSLGETVTATGIDIGLGALPGIGIGVTAINAGLAIAGRDTIGQTIADALFSGNSKGLVTAAGTPTGDGGLALDLNKTDSVASSEVESTRPAETGDFAWKYLSKRDETKRPTPREKYYTNRESYGANYA